MICDIANAYPSNGVCLDASKNHEFKYTFYGDYAIGHDIMIYDAETGEQTGAIFNDRGDNTGGYYNGEEIGNRIANLSQNKAYLWKARIYDKLIDVSSGIYPDILVTKGQLLDIPIIISAVTEMSEDVQNASEKAIAIGTGLNINIPSYIFIGDESRKITSYDDTVGVIGIDKKFTTYPEVGTEVIINTKTRTKLNVDDIANAVFIEPNNTTIKATTYRPSTSSTDHVSNVYIKIADEYIALTDHDTKNGILYLESTPSVSDAGTTYEVYCNYIDTPFFSFVTKNTPIITASADLWDAWKTIFIKCTATLGSNTSNITIKSYHWEIYDIDANGNRILIEKSKEIFSGRMEYLGRIIKPTASYIAKIVATTKDGIVLENEAGVAWASTIQGIDKLASVFEPAQNRVKLTWTNVATNTSFTILRTDSSGKIEYLETILKSTNVYYDYKVVNHGAYTYHVIPKGQTELRNMAETTVKTDFSAISIYFLSEVEYERPPESVSVIRIDTNFMYPDAQYKIEKIYNAEMNLGEMKIIHNISRDVQIGHNGLPIITVGADNYDSFPLEFTFGQLSCDKGKQMKLFEHTHKDYIVWRDYVASGLPVVIKDYMGNIWFGTITSHSPTPDTVGNPNLYHISLDFTQTKKINEFRILTD